MLNVCAQCGAYHADKVIDPAGPYAICPECGHLHLFRYLPLFIVGGASGTGKSAVCHALLAQDNINRPDVIILDADILWRPEFAQPDDDYRGFFNTWLRMCKNIAQSGKTVTLFGAGAGVPGNIEPCVERRYFAAIHYLALVCNDDDLVTRLRNRPRWRESGNDAFIQTQLDFNHWYMTTGLTLTPPITLLDTTRTPVTETARQIDEWIHSLMKCET